MRSTSDEFAHDALCELVLKRCADANEHARRWVVALHPLEHPWWIFVSTESSDIPSQGWKLHLSAGLASALAVVERALDVLLSDNAPFKVVASLDRLAALNAGEAGMTQAGKCLTIYPLDPDHAVRLAAALDAATRGLRGPAILSDRPLVPGSLVHYRYGSFVDREVVDGGGTRTHLIVDPDGVLVPDVRGIGWHAPSWAIDPFIAAGVSPLPRDPEPILNKRYLLTEILSSTVRGTVARAVDLVEQRPCILKRAAHDAAMDYDGRDARDYLRQGAEILTRLSSDPRFPVVLDQFSYQGDYILVRSQAVPQLCVLY